jgi:hypothetical protein
MRRHCLVPLILLSLAVLTAPARASGQEVQVALDEAGRVDEIDRALARRTGLFIHEYPQLQMVRLYRVEPDAYVLEVTEQRDGRAVRQRISMTADEVQALRARVSAALEVATPERVLDQDGRFLLVGATTLLGLGYYGWAVPAILDLDGRGAVAAYMFTAGGSFVVPFLYTRTRPVTYGMANAGFWGATRGIAAGSYLAVLLDPEPGQRAVLGLGMAGSLGTGLAMYEWARRTDMPAGDAHVIGNHGDFGHMWGLSTMGIIQPDQPRVVVATLLAGSGLGVWWGASRAPRLPYTWGDAEIQRGAFWLGAWNSIALWEIVAGGDPGTDMERVLGAMLIGGSAGGLYLADRVLLPGHDFSAGQGILVNLGAVAGGLLGLGVAYLVAPERVDRPTIFLTLGALGANAGFGLTYYALADDARRADGTRPPLEVGINPAGLLKLAPAGLGAALPEGMAVPLLGVRYRF